MAFVIGTLLLIVGFIAGAVLLGARRLALRADRARAEPLEPRSTFPTVAVVPARHLSTHLAGTNLELSVREFPPDAEGELGVTEREVSLAQGLETVLYVPVSRVSEAALVGAFRGEEAGERRQFVRISWQRGGDEVTSVFEVNAKRHDAERIRREIHLRAGRAGTLWTPPAEPPAGP